MLRYQGFTVCTICYVNSFSVQFSMVLSLNYSNSWSKRKTGCQDEVHFFLLPFYILVSEPVPEYESFFLSKPSELHHLVSRLMEDKTECKLLFCSSLSALQKIAPLLHPDVGIFVFKVLKFQLFFITVVFIVLIEVKIFNLFTIFWF